MLAEWYGARRYYEEKGFAVILVSRILNLLALAFTIMFSAFLLLFVKWRALHSECILRDTCDISEASHLPPQLHLCASIIHARRRGNPSFEAKISQGIKSSTVQPKAFVT